MKRKVFNELVVCIFFQCISLSNVLADVCDLNFDLLDVGGFTIDSSKIDILADNKFTEYSLQLGETAVVEQITKVIKSVNESPRGSESPEALAQNIFDASKAYGVDPLLYAAKVWQESGQFNVDVVADGGDTGLTQMTGDGLDEIYEQYVKINSKNKTERKVGQILANLSKNYFGTDKVTNEWVDWVIEKTNSQKKKTLVKSVDYALASGASLFKIYLAAKSGSYKKAINQFNGGGVKNYFGKVTTKEDMIKNASHKCKLSEESLKYLDSVCEMTGSQRGCEQVIQEVLPGNQNSYYDI